MKGEYQNANSRLQRNKVSGRRSDRPRNWRGRSARGRYGILIDTLETGKKLKVCTFDELNADSYVATPYFAGSIPAPGSRAKKAKEITAGSMVKALRFMEEVIKRKIMAVVATEIGGGNTACALHLGALLGLPLVDGDHVGRSAPELIQTSYYINGLSLTPSVVVTVNGDFLLIKEYSSIDSYEKIVRMIAEQVRGTVFIIDSPVDVDTAKKVAVVGSVSKAMELGESIERARARGLETANVVAEELEGYVVFKGKIIEHNLREEKGFLTGHILIEGSENYRNSNLKVWIKNESRGSMMNQ